MSTFAFNKATLGVKIQPKNDSFFPPSEGPSINSRPTPVVPASAELLGKSDGGSPWTDVTVAMALDADVSVTMESGPAPSLPPSEAPPSEAPPSVPASSSRDSMEHHFYNSAPSVAPLSLAPPLDPPAPRRSRARSALSKALFTLLFGAVIALLGYALREKLTRGEGGGVGSVVSSLGTGER
jgi:hypothetical protein